MPIPLVVIAELMGLPVEDRFKLGHWSDRMMGGEGRPDPADPVALDAGEAFDALPVAQAARVVNAISHSTAMVVCTSPALAWVVV